MIRTLWVCNDELEAMYVEAGKYTAAVFPVWTEELAQNLNPNNRPVNRDFEPRTAINLP
jgi:hypothetical protein